ncbi:MAG: cbb3-type cytochrome c oxidase subunit II [Bacteroidota bacterium]|nr:cbb3-type cytochrome c oxidase subunit II [Bacteroidota bacterium]MDP4212970.1 cbb3-type cytochrome c oxidase subunit II [Bacteroidota bacterium]MDP4250792.1 cbb3-type cytochrome c oxidase subunit II [Bacteroidota bacterium]
MELFDNHQTLFRTAFLFFAGLTVLVAIIPALNNQRNFAPLPNAEPLSEAAAKGKAIFIANGCVACHTQQVRNVDMDKVWGDRPSIAADYAGNHRTDFWRNTATLMGSERTGPDLTNIGKRQPGKEWNLVHLFNPRIVVGQSVMPAYSWLFEIKDSADKGDVLVNVPKEYLNGLQGKVVATPDALYLVAYLQSLKQTRLPDGNPAPEFLYKKEIKTTGDASKPAAADGVALYTANCQSCHQANGEGLKGAFPPLKGSPVVLNENPEQMINIILNGYTGRIQEGYGPMPAIGTLNNLSPEEITAIMNHEKSSWGNNGKPVTVEEVKKVADFLKITTAPK